MFRKCGVFVNYHAVSMHKTSLVSMSYHLEFLKIAGVTYDPVKSIRYNIVTK